MRKNMAIAIPKLETSAYEWIQKFRAQHDANYELEPHFTFVFPDLASSADRFKAEIEKQLSTFTSFDFCVRAALYMPKNFEGDSNYVFLVPDEGLSQMIKLHDRLHSGSLRPRL